MSMLSAQIKELRETAVSLGVNGVCTGDLSKLYVMLREAADTIESLSDKLQGVMGTRYSELFGTPERAARTAVALNNRRVVSCEDCAARGACRYDGCGDDYDALLEWLEGGAE